MIAAIIAAVIVAGCTGKVAATEKDQPLYIITEKPCSGIIAVDVVKTTDDNRAILTAGLQEIEKTHKIIFWAPKQTSWYSGYNPTTGYDVLVEVNESCRQ